MLNRFDVGCVRVLDHVAVSMKHYSTPQSMMVVLSLQPLAFRAQWNTPQWCIKPSIKRLYRFMIKPFGVYGFKNDIVRLLQGIGAIDDNVYVPPVLIIPLF
jgi:hypothetical protein